MVSISIKARKQLVLHSVLIDSFVLPKVVVQGAHYIAVGEHADLWLGKDGGYLIVCQFFLLHLSMNPHLLCVFSKVALKKLRKGIVEKQPELKDQFNEVGSQTHA
jgi:hypothetical protein